MRTALLPMAPAVVLAAVMAATGLPAASAADKILLGGGAGILLHDEALCTLTTIGYDGSGQLVGFTAAHCGGPGSPVVVEGAEDYGVVGTVVAADEGLDYAVVEFDTAKISPIADYEGFGIFGLGSLDPVEPVGPDPVSPEPVGPDGPEPVGPDAPAPVSPEGAEHAIDAEHPVAEHVVVHHACKLGRGTGLTCFDVGPAGVESADEQWWLPGDDGAPVTVDNMLVGMVRDGTVPGGPLTQPGPGIVLFQAILDDVNAKGGPGAGFGRRS
ncbi:serine protease [Mycolicibacter minnesotensis]